MNRLSEVAKTKGWETALYEYYLRLVASDERLPEDSRSADWSYFLPLSRQQKVLVIGCGLGTVPIALAQSCGDVHVADVNNGAIEFLRQRMQQQRIENLHVRHTPSLSKLPFQNGFFDLISIGSFVHERALMSELCRVLKPNGLLHLQIGNKLAFHRLLRRDEQRSDEKRYTLFGIKRILSRYGFISIRCYAPLPDHQRIPLFYIPIQNGRGLDFFFSHLFPLFEMVSTEVKGQFGPQYRLAKWGVRCTSLLKLSSVAKHFFPSYGVIASRSTSSPGGA